METFYVDKIFSRITKIRLPKIGISPCLELQMQKIKISLGLEQGTEITEDVKLENEYKTKVVVNT